MYAEEAEFAKEKTKAGKTRYSKWRMNHAHAHRNVQPGKFGEPMLRHNLDNQLLDPLHMAELGIPKTPWKHGVLNNASDDAREQISESSAKRVEAPAGLLAQGGQPQPRREMVHRREMGKLLRRHGWEPRRAHGHCTTDDDYRG